MMHRMQCRNAFVSISVLRTRARVGQGVHTNVRPSVRPLVHSNEATLMSLAPTEEFTFANQHWRGRLIFPSGEVDYVLLFLGF